MPTVNQLIRKPRQAPAVSALISGDGNRQGDDDPDPGTQ